VIAFLNQNLGSSSENAFIKCIRNNHTYCMTRIPIFKNFLNIEAKGFASDRQPLIKPTGFSDLYQRWNMGAIFNGLRIAFRRSLCLG